MVLYEFYDCLTKAFVKGGQNSFATNPLISFKKTYISREQFLSIAEIYLNYLKRDEKDGVNPEIYFYGLDIKNFEMLFVNDYKNQPQRLKTAIRDRVYNKIEESIKIKNIYATFTTA